MFRSDFTAARRRPPRAGFFASRTLGGFVAGAALLAAAPNALADGHFGGFAQPADADVFQPTGPTATPEVPGDAGVARPSETERARLLSRQQALHAALLVTPNDVPTLLEYARVSRDLGDAEAAITALERALQYSPETWRIRAALAALYARLDSGAAAEQYLRQAREGAREEAGESRVAQARRLSGFVSAGLYYNTNLNFGSDALFDAGLPRGEEDGVGARVNGRLTYAPSSDLFEGVWRTDARFDVRQNAEISTTDATAASLRFGPEFRGLTGLFGGAARFQPFVETTLFVISDEVAFVSVDFGLRGLERVSDSTIVAAETTIGYREYGPGAGETRDRRDALRLRTSLRSLTELGHGFALGLSGAVGYRDATIEAFSGWRFEGGVELRRDYAAPFGIGFFGPTETPWRTSVAVTGSVDASNAIDRRISVSNTTVYRDLRLRLAQRIPLTDDVSFEASVSSFTRDAHETLYDVDALEVATSLRVRF